MRNPLWRVALVLICVAGSASAAAPDHSLYARVAARLAADPALARTLGQPPKELRAMSWMIGAWTVAAEVQAGAHAAKPDRGVSVVTPVLGGTWLQIRDSYPKGTQDLGYLTFNPATRRWTSVSLDSLGNLVMTGGDGWSGNTLVLSGDATIVGVTAHLRQTMHKLDARTYVVTNEERDAGGRWALLDTYRYTKAR